MPKTIYSVGDRTHVRYVQDKLPTHCTYSPYLSAPVLYFIRALPRLLGITPSSLTSAVGGTLEATKYIPRGVFQYMQCWELNSGLAYAQHLLSLGYLPDYRPYNNNNYYC